MFMFFMDGHYILLHIPPSIFTAHLPVEPLVPVPMSPLGLQLVRDPNTGHLLLLPTTGIGEYL